MGRGWPECGRAGAGGGTGGCCDALWVIVISDFGSSDEDVAAAFGEQVEAGTAW